MDFEYWIDGVVGICELIAEKDLFWKVWVDHDYTKTSIHYYDELYEQLVGDLHLDELIVEFKPHLGEEQINVLGGFAKALKVLDSMVEGTEGLKDPKVLLSSVEWARFREDAARVTKVFGPTVVRA